MRVVTIAGLGLLLIAPSLGAQQCEDVPSVDYPELTIQFDENFDTVTLIPDRPCVYLFSGPVTVNVVDQSNTLQTVVLERFTLRPGKPNKHNWDALNNVGAPLAGSGPPAYAHKVLFLSLPSHSLDVLPLLSPGDRKKLDRLWDLGDLDPRLVKFTIAAYDGNEWKYADPGLGIRP